MSVKLLTEHHLEFLSLKEAAQARLSQHLSKCHIVGNHMWRLICSELCSDPTLCMPAAKVLRRLHLCTSLSQLLLLSVAIGCSYGNPLPATCE